MSDAWPAVRLADLAAPVKGAIAGGPFGSDLVSADYVDEGVPVIRGVNLPFDRKIDLENLVFVSESKADSLHLNCAAPGDLVFTQRGTLGQVGLLPEHPRYSRYLISQSQMKMTVDPTKASALYLYYYFRLPSSVAYVENHALQSGVPHINLGILRKLEVILPPLAVQHRIAAVLEAYDDLIANNQRRIALLESMAEEIYREWFVRMRFPGAAVVARKKGIPSGWRVCTIADLFLTSSGGTPSRSNPENFSGAIPWVKTGELKKTFISATEECISEIGLESSAAKLLPARTIVMAMYCAMPDVAILGVAAATNQACCALTPRSTRLGLTWSYFFARNALSQMVNFAHGAAQQNLSQEIIRRFKVLAPDEPLIERFGVAADPLFEQVSVLYRQTALLRASRDALLPRLIAGKLRVDHLDIQFPPSMQPPTEAALAEALA